MKELNEMRYTALFDVRTEIVAAELLAQDKALLPEQIVVAPKASTTSKPSRNQGN